jgi:GNAT superfamily N-acetyltransferase
MRTDIVPTAERDGTAADVSFMFHSWLKGSRDAWPAMRNDDYFALQHQRIERLIASDARLVVLHPERTPAVIAAWALLDRAGPDVVHYVHVKGEYRRMGFATRLLVGRTIATHMTEVGEKLKRKLGLRYMPHLLDGMAG